MKRVLKIASYSILGVVSIVGAGFLYMFRQQAIDVQFIPNEFAYCGDQIWGNDQEYREIVDWLKNNKDGWARSVVTYVPKQVYDSPAFKVNVMDSGVVVSYKTDFGYPQFVKSINHGLRKNCAENS